MKRNKYGNQTATTNVIGVKMAACIAGIFACMIMLPSCHLFPRDDPADSGGTNYQGFPNVLSVADVAPVAPEGELSFPPTLKGTKVVGADRYRFRIALDAGASQVGYDKEFDTNVVNLSDWLPANGPGTYWFSLMARKNAQWGPWSASQSFVLKSSGTVATPTISPDAGTYTTAQMVTIASATPGVSIRFTTDGTDPTIFAGTLYSAPFLLESTATVRALAYKPGWANAPITSKSYVITGTVAAPTFSIPSGTYTGAQSISINCATEGATIRYTTNGSAPTETNGTVYGSAVPISSTTTLKTVAYIPGWATSTVSTAVYTIRYTVTYDGNGNTGGNVPTDSMNYLAGAMVTVLGNTGSLTKTGLTFDGWNTDAAGTGTNRAVASTFTMGSANLILYAKWSPSYTVAYDGNGNTAGSVPTDSSTYLAGTTVTILGNTGSLTKTGYVFAGWNTEATGTGTNRAAASTFTMGSANVTLYAKWRDYVIGDTGPAGGLVFYDKGSYSSGWRYLEAAPSDQSTSIKWWNGSFVTTGAIATGIGSGSANTSTIVSVQGVGSYAASICANLVLGGYDDWFLPSKEELGLMYANLKVAGRGGFASEWYWSSSEYLDWSAWEQHFYDGSQGTNGNKLGSDYVRAVRAF